MHLNWFYATSFTRALNNLLTYKTTEVMDFYKGVSKDFETLRKAMQGPLSLMHQKSRKVGKVKHKEGT